MPASSDPIPFGPVNDVWHQHKAQIKDLYQNQRKTLREVKQIMENNGFPKTPLSTWESKLREELQLRKKAKSHNWPLIYRHILPRLEYPGKKRLKKQTIIRLNGSKIPWDKAWKEIRRSGALATDQHSTTLNPLPPEVTIRSPSPGPISSPRTPPAVLPVVPVVSTQSSDTTSAALVPLQISVVAPPLQARSLTYSFSVFLLQWCASSIPWLEMFHSVQHTFRDAKQSRQLELSFSLVLNEFLAESATARAVRSQTRDEFKFPEGRLDLLRDHRLVPPRPSPDLGYRVAKYGGQIELSHFMSTAIFLLSNNLYDDEDGDQGLQLFCSLLDRNAFLTSTFLQSHLPSVRAAWESLFRISMKQKRHYTFRALADIGIHKHWLNPWQSASYLRYAVEMDCYDIVRRIVAYCCESNCSHWWRDSFEAILVACRKGDTVCASLLLRYCNVNARRVRSRDDRSMFQDLVANLERSNDEHTLALELFLSNGADVDKKSARRRIIRRWRRLVARHELLHATRPTMLDEIFYMNRLMFNKAQAYSRVPASSVTRTGLLAALEKGSQTAQEYLSVRQPGSPYFDAPHLQLFLDLILAEQFEMSKIVDMKIVQGLFELGVDFEKPSVALNVQDFWRIDEWDPKCNNSIIDIPRRKGEAGYLQFAWQNFASVKERTALLDMVLAHGGVIGEHVLESAFAQRWTDRLECLPPRLVDSPNKAVRALVRAARLNKFEAVEWLFRKGVDPNAYVISHGLSYSIQALATQACRSESHYELPDGGCSLMMVRLLAKHGARLVVTPEDSTPFDFAHHLLRKGSTSELLAKMKYFLDTMVDYGTQGRLPSSLLESCAAQSHRNTEDKWREKRLEVFEYLFRQGAEVTPGSSLAALVFLGGREELARDLLHSGADLNAYRPNHYGCDFTPLQLAASNGDENLVRLFLSEGANVNSPPSVPQYFPMHGFTALEAICRWLPATEEEHQRKMRICLLLIHRGAYVNTAHSTPAIKVLVCAAMSGDLELAALLLREGADINATSDFGTALDEAASRGRSDMVKFLLNANALSCVRGRTGYDGAIHRAKKYGKLAVAGLIREHAAKVEAGTVFNPELWKPPEERYFYGFAELYESLNLKHESSSDNDNDDIAVGLAVEASGPTNVGPGYMVEASAVHGENFVAAGGEPSSLVATFVLSEEDWPSGTAEEYVQSSNVLDPTESWNGQSL